MSDDTFKGQAVQATWQIEDGKHTGRHVWDASSCSTTNRLRP